MTKNVTNGAVQPEAPVTRSRSRQMQHSSPPKSALTGVVHVNSSKSSKKRKKRTMADTNGESFSVSAVPAFSPPSSVKDHHPDKNGSVILLAPSSITTNSICDKTHATSQDGQNEEREASHLTLWHSPIKTLRYFLMECFCLLQEYGVRCARITFLLPLTVMTLLVAVTYNLDGAHQSYVKYLEKKLFICLYWIGLGVLSSIGLGTGLHTFILYLGPHIASVTLAAYECGTLNFPEPPYPDQIVCPEGQLDNNFHITLWSIISKVRLESFMWGLGTAIGELPPYFMARAARLSGRESEELMEVQALLENRAEHRRLTLMQKAKIFMEQLVAKVGFFGILLGASIPNPLFDLAGITCGHFLVPFGTFFGATLLGKAVIKMHIQMIFVVITFSERHVEHLISLFTRIPRLGPYMERPFVDFLEKQKRNLHRKPGTDIQQNDSSWLQFLFEKVVICMVVYFVLSIVHSLAQNYHRRSHGIKQKDK